MPYRLVKEVVDPVLDDGELVESSAKAVGCTLVLTDRRLLVVRERASQRPRFGIVGWPLDQELVIRLTPAYHATRQLVLSRLSAGA